MILDDKIKITVNPNSRIHFIKLGYNCNNYDEIEVNPIDLPSGSNIIINCKCDLCDQENSIKYNRWYKNTKGNKIEYTCKRCSHIKVKRTKLEKYGDENYQNIDKIKKTKLEKYGDENYTNRTKAKSTCIKKWGVENPSQSIEIKNLKKQTTIKKWSVENPFQSDEIKKKIKDKSISKWGVEYYLLSDDFKVKYKEFCNRLGVNHYSETDEFKLKFKETCLERYGQITNLLSSDIKDKIKYTNLIKYGFDHVMKNKDMSLLNTRSLVENRSSFFNKLGYEYLDYNFDDKLYKLKNLECNHIFEINYDLFRSRIKYSNSSCLICYPKSELSSIKEKELTDFLLKEGIEVIENNRSLIGRELDIYLPQYNLAIEFNGLYWHSDKFKEKDYHFNKTKLCNDIGVSLIHIWEDDWIYKKEIIKSIIKNRINKIDKKIYARKCTIRDVSVKDAKLFLDENHIQGKSNSSLRLGLYYENELVSLMTFGWRSINKKMEYELIRFCNKKDFIVIGSADKLFKYFLKSTKIGKIISYSDSSIFRGDLYEKLGFKNDGFTGLNYYWTDLNRKYHRFNFNKRRLVKMGYDDKMTEEEIMKSIGFYKLWSCGQIRWIYEI